MVLDKAPQNLAPPVPTERGVSMPTERKIRLNNRMVSSVGYGEARKGKELGKESGKGEVKDNPLSEGYRQ